LALKVIKPRVSSTSNKFGPAAENPLRFNRESASRSTRAGLYLSVNFAPVTLVRFALTVRVNSCPTTSWFSQGVAEDSR